MEGTDVHNKLFGSIYFGINNIRFLVTNIDGPYMDLGGQWDLTLKFDSFEAKTH